MMWHVILWAGVALVAIIVAAIIVIGAAAVAVTVRDMWRGDDRD
jgi:hypothetical protein